MISIYDNNTLAAALAQPIAPNIGKALRARWAHSEALDLAGLTYLLVVQAGDEEAEIEQEIGFRPSVSPIDGISYGASGFTPYWSWLGDLGGWYELIVTIGNSGFAFVLLIEKAEGAPRTLLRMCQEHAQCA